MKLRHVLIIISGVFCLVAGAPDFSRAQSVPAAVEQFKNDLLKVLAVFHDPKLNSPEAREIKRQKIWALLEPAFDEHIIIPDVLKSTWPQLSESRQAELLPVAAKVIKWKFIGKLYKYGVEDVFFKGVRFQGKRLYLEGRLGGGIIDHPVVFIFIKKEDSWSAFDLKVHNYSLVSHYRKKFDKTYAQKGFNGLVNHLIDEVKEELEEMGFDPDTFNASMAH